MHKGHVARHGCDAWPRRGAGIGQWFRTHTTHGLVKRHLATSIDLVALCYAIVSNPHFLLKRSSWNVFAGGVDEEKIKGTIDAMAELTSAGYGNRVQSCSLVKN